MDYAGEFRPLADGAIVTYFTFEAGYIIAAMPQRVIEFLRGISLFGLSYGAAPNRLRSSRGHLINLRTVLAHIFNSSAVLGVRRQPLDTAIHPGGSACCTRPTASSRDVAAAQNSAWSPLIALTTWTTLANTFFMPLAL